MSRLRSFLVASLRKLAILLIEATVLAIDYPRAIIGSCCLIMIPRVRAVIDGPDPNSSSVRYAVYVSYNRYGMVADYVVTQVEALARLGYRVLFVSTSPKLPTSEVTKILKHSWRILHRRNIGYDFGAYKDGIRQIGSMDRPMSLILMNDSCYGPLFDLESVEQQARESRSDIWGITDSWQKAYHLQSYLLRIDSRALRSKAFSSFWATLLPYQPRSLVIRHGEIRFTQHLLRRGMIANALCPYQTVASRALSLISDRLSGRGAQLLSSEKKYLESLANEISKGTPLNPMHSFWDVLIVEFACPFIKRELLRRNPARIPGLVEWPLLVQKYTDYDVEAICQHLKVR